MSMKNLLSLMVLCVIVLGPVTGWAETGEAPSSWKGRATVRVNVRKAPGKGAEVMTQVDQGEEVTVKDIRNGWFKVYVEGATFGFEGWIYGKYITPAAGTDVTVVGLRVLKDAQIETARPDRVNPPRGKRTTSEKETPKLGSASKTVSSKREAGERKAEKVTDIPPSNKRRFEEPPETEPSTGVAQKDETPLFAYEAPAEKAPERIATPSAPGQISSPAGRVPFGKPSRDKRRIASKGTPGADQKRGGAFVDVRNKADVYRARKTSAAAKPHGEGVYQSVVGVIIRLVVVAFSCLALLFAHRALLTTRRARQ